MPTTYDQTSGADLVPFLGYERVRPYHVRVSAALQALASGDSVKLLYLPANSVVCVYPNRQVAEGGAVTFSLLTTEATAQYFLRAADGNALGRLLADGEVGAGLLTPYLSKVVSGVAAAGPVTLTGARVGDKVLGVANITDGADGASAFESTITVADQIQQSSASDLHTKAYLVQVAKRGGALTLKIGAADTYLKFLANGAMAAAVIDFDVEVIADPPAALPGT